MGTEAELTPVGAPRFGAVIVTGDALSEPSVTE
jgi:hypothetical protein